MKIKHSLVTRRKFLNGLFGGWIAALGASLFFPLFKFVFPPYKEPDEVFLNASDYEGMDANTTKTFAWGAKPGLMKKNDDMSLTAFVAVCTHLDCTVSYMPDKEKFFCACHDGWYDKNGINIKGPPSSPLRKLGVTIEGAEIKISKNSDKGEH